MLRLLSIFTCLTLLYSVPVQAGDTVDLTDEKTRLSYSIGYQVGGDFRKQEIEISPEFLVQGVQDALAEREPSMTPAEMRATLTDLNTRIAAAKEEKKVQKAKAALLEGQMFLEKNADKENIIVLLSGLQYEVIKKGMGVSPRATDTVTVHYRGTLIDGTEFDSSFKRGKPATFRLDRVIKGWTEGLQLMKPGASYRFFIPSDLAYGESGAGGLIGPNSALIFEVELLSSDGT